MLGKDVPEKPQYCHQCGEATSPGYSPPNNPGTVYCKTHYEQLFASRCEGCNQPIVGQYLNAQGKKFHVQCAPEAGRCERCHKPIIGESVSLYEKIYHPKCFTCTKCNVALSSSYEEIGKSPFCMKCAGEIAQARAANQAIPGLVYESAEDKEKRERARIQNELYANVQAGKEGCAWCRKVVASEAVSFGGRLYHEGCFMCTQCADVIGFNPFTEQGGNAYCRKCAKPAATGGACGGCNQPLSGQFVVAFDVKYHPQCFKCTECRADLKGGFAAKAGKPVCPNCATAKVTAVPVASGEKQRGFVVDPRSGRKIMK